MDKDRRTEQKTRHVYHFGKRNAFRLDLNESRKGFCRTTTTTTAATAYLPHFVVDLRLCLLQDVLVGGQHEEGEGHDRGGGVVPCQQEHQGVGFDLVLRQTCGQ